MVTEYFFDIGIKGIGSKQIKFVGNIEQFNFDRLKISLKAFERAQMRKMKFSHLKTAIMFSFYYSVLMRGLIG